MILGEQNETATIRNVIAIWVTGKRWNKTVRRPLSRRPGLVYLFNGRIGSTRWPRRQSRYDGGIFALNVRTAVGETHAHTNEYGGGRILRRLSAKRYQTVEHTWAACVRRTCFRCISALNAATATKIAHADHYHCVYAHTDRAPRFRPVVRGTRPGGLHRNYCTAETCAALFSKVRNIYLFSCFQFSPVIVKHRIYTCQFVSVRSSFSLRSSRREGQARIQKRRESMNSPLHFINFLPKKTRLYSNVLRHFKSDKT